MQDLILVKRKKAGVIDMGNIDFTIDFIQSTKKQFVNATVTNPVMKKGLNEFVDKQTELCKIITHNFETFTKEIISAPSICGKK